MDARAPDLDRREYSNQVLVLVTSSLKGRAFAGRDQIRVQRRR